MENNNTGSGVGTTAAPRNGRGLAHLAPSEFALFFLNMQSDFRKDLWLKEFNGLTHITYDDKWQSARSAANRLLREIIQNINVNKK